MTPTHVSADLRRQVSEDAGHRCGYCLTDEALNGDHWSNADWQSDRCGLAA